MSGKTLTSMTPNFEPESDSDEKGFGIEFNEYECGSYCNENGCPGHTSDLPVGFWLDGALFYVAGHEGGDFPDGSEVHHEKVRKAVGRIEMLTGLEEKLLKLVAEWKKVAQMRFERGGETPECADATALVDCAEDIEGLLKGGGS